jgi:hypothetical protein
MAYSVSKLSRVSSTANSTADILWSYRATDESLASMKASGYFNNAMEDLTNGRGRFKSGDIIYLEGSDGPAIVRITSVASSVTVEDYINGNSIKDSSISLEHLDTAMTPSHIVKFAGVFITTGGNAVEDKEIVGVVANDIVHVQLKDSTAGASIERVSAALNKITVVYSVDPENLTTVYYTIFRAAA